MFSFGLPETGTASPQPKTAACTTILKPYTLHLPDIGAVRSRIEFWYNLHFSYKQEL